MAVVPDRTVSADGPGPCVSLSVTLRPSGRFGPRRVPCERSPSGAEQLLGPRLPLPGAAAWAVRVLLWVVGLQPC